MVSCAFKAQPAQIRTGGFPAYGSYLGWLTAKRARGHGWRILGLGSHSAASFSILCHVESVPLAAALERAQPEAADVVVEDREGATIGRHRVVVKVAADDRSQPLPLEGDCLMPPLSQFLQDFLEFRPHAVASGLPVEQEVALERLAADEGEPQEVEGFRFAEPSPRATFRRKASELDQSGLLGMQLQAKLGKSLLEIARVSDLGQPARIRRLAVGLALILVDIGFPHSPALADDASALTGHWIVPSREQKKSRMGPQCQQDAETDVQTVPESEIEIFSCDDPAFAALKTRILEFVKSVNEVYRAQNRPLYSDWVKSNDCCPKS
jgi:hypothetical protein